MKRIAILILILFATPVWGATYYVDQSGGNDGAAGTSEGTAWSSIAKVNDYAEATGFSDGDSILFKKGETWGSGQETLGDDGTDINWGTINGLTIGAYGSGNLPRFDANQFVPINITAPNVDNLVIEYLDLSGMDAISGSRALMVDGQSSSQTDGMQGVTIRYCIINGATGASSYPRPQAAIRLDDIGGDITVNNNTLSNYIQDTWANTITSWGLNDSLGIIIKYDDGGDQTVAKTAGTVSIYSNSITTFYADHMHLNNIRTTTNIYDNTLDSFGENIIDLKGCRYVNIYNNVMSDSDGRAGEGGTGSDGPMIVIHDSDATGYYDSDNISVYENYGYNHDRGVFRLLNNSTNISFLRNFWKVGQYGEINPSNLVTLRNETIYIYTTSADEDAVLRIFNHANNDNILFENSTIYVTATDHTDVIRLDNVAGQTGNIFRNLIIQIADSDPVDCFDVDNTTGITATYSACYNSLNDDRHQFNGVSYGKNDEAAWRSAGHTGGLLFATETPGLTDVGNEEFWPTKNAAVVGAADESNYATNGLRYDATWNPFNVITLARSDPDMGAYEYSLLLEQSGVNIQ
jgi:hypothetical protein